MPDLRPPKDTEHTDRNTDPARIRVAQPSKDASHALRAGKIEMDEVATLAAVASSGLTEFRVASSAERLMLLRHPQSRA
jgi:hypothetical protein